MARCGLGLYSGGAGRHASWPFRWTQAASPSRGGEGRHARTARAARGRVARGQLHRWRFAASSSRGDKGVTRCDFARHVLWLCARRGRRLRHAGGKGRHVARPDRHACDQGRHKYGLPPKLGNVSVTWVPLRDAPLLDFGRRRGWWAQGDGGGPVQSDVVQDIAFARRIWAAQAFTFSRSMRFAFPS